MIEINQDTYKPYEDKMAKSIEVLKEEFNAIRVGRANPHVLDKIKVMYYGVETPLNQVANVQIPEPRVILLTPWDVSILKEIEQAIQSSDLGINPNNDGKAIRLNFPVLTEERRKELAKQVSAYGEDAKVAVRNIRRDGMDKFKQYLKKKEITEDALHEVEEKIQKITNKFIEKIDKIVEGKKAELMEI